MKTVVVRLKTIKNSTSTSKKFECFVKKMYRILKIFNHPNFRYNKRRILLRLAYFGKQYRGLATQEDCTNTIEHHLFNALEKSRLIPSRDQANYHRCGRTDKGVSASGQVIINDLKLKINSNKN